MSTTTKKKIRKNFKNGRVYINARYNNTIVTLTCPEGKVLGWSSPGSNGFKGARQSTPYAGQISAEKVAEMAQGFGMEEIDVYVKGMGPARDQTIRGLFSSGLNLLSISELTRRPHGGCRAKKVRHV
jgi:small subunit ribosomal protein S11